MPFPRSEMRIDPRNDQATQTTKRNNNKTQNGAGAQRNQHKPATSRSEGTARAHHCR